jgi:hypothetical protein
LSGIALKQPQIILICRSKIACRDASFYSNIAPNFISAGDLCGGGGSGRVHALFEGALFGERKSLTSTVPALIRIPNRWCNLLLTFELLSRCAQRDETYGGKKKKFLALQGYFLNSSDVCVGEITAFEQQRFTRFFCKCISKAVVEIQLSRMPTPSSEISVGVSRDLRLNLSDRFNGDVCFSNEIIKAPRGYRIALASITTADSTKLTALTRRIVASAIARAGHGLWFIAKDGNDRRRVDNHLGSPRSS